jgi:hypothetical protein
MVWSHNLSSNLAVLRVGLMMYCSKRAVQGVGMVMYSCNMAVSLLYISD